MVIRWLIKCYCRVNVSTTAQLSVCVLRVLSAFSLPFSFHSAIEVPVNSIECCNWLHKCIHVHSIILSLDWLSLFYFSGLPAVASISMTLEMRALFSFLSCFFFLFFFLLLCPLLSLVFLLFSRALSFRWIFHTVSEWFRNFSLHLTINVYVGVKEKYWMYICIKFTPRGTSRKVERHSLLLLSLLPLSTCERDGASRTEVTWSELQYTALNCKMDYIYVWIARREKERERKKEKENETRGQKCADAREANHSVWSQIMDRLR